MDLSCPPSKIVRSTPGRIFSDLSQVITNVCALAYPYQLFISDKLLQNDKHEHCHTIFIFLF
jgi:hypothetical protein